MLMALKFICIDPNIDLCKKTLSTIKKYPGIELVKSFHQLAPAVDFILHHEIDFFLMDPSFSSQEEQAVMHSRIDFSNVIFSSENKADAALGYDLGVVDFIPKPMDFYRFELAISRLIQMRKQKEARENTFIEVRCNFKNEKVIVDDIQWIEAMGNYVKIVTPIRKYIILSSMNKIQKLLPEKYFFRTHKSFLINLNKVDRYSTKEIHIGKDAIPLSRLRKKEFQKTFG